MKRSVALVLTTLTLLSGLADAARRSGGGFGGSRSSGGGYSGRTYNTPSYRVPRTPSYTPAPYAQPRNSSSGSRYTAPSPVPATPKTNLPKTAPLRTNLPSTASVRTSPLNTAAAARVTPTQLGNWNKLKLPAGVPRSAVTYSAAPSSQYRYQLQPGRYFPYPQSYYRQNNIGYDILKYALIFTAVSSIANAMTPDVVVNNVNVTNVGEGSSTASQGDLSDLRGKMNTSTSTTVTEQRGGPNLWTYAGVGFLAAAAGWFVLGRKRG